MKQQEYWASVDPKDIGEAILQKVDDFYKYMMMTGRMDLLRRSWSYYYRPRLTGGMLNPVGEQGELTSISVNDYRNLLCHIENMTLQQAPAFEPTGTNSDSKTQAQVILATGLLDYYMRQKKLERNFKTAVKGCLISAESFVRVEWNPSGGEIFGQTPQGTPAYQGDIRYRNYNMINVPRDFTLESPADEIWWIPRDYVNKYSLAATYASEDPELYEKIISGDVDRLRAVQTAQRPYLSSDESDNIAVYTLLHEPCPALPKGRYTEVLEDGTTLIDGPLPYEKTHMYRIAPDEEEGTIFGYTTAFDQLPIQELTDMLFSTVATNQATHGVQNVIVPKGHDLSTAQVAGGLNLMECDYNLGKPEALNLLYTPPEVFKFIDMTRGVHQTISGVDAVTRGDPGSIPNAKSGSALALIAAQSIQFSMGLQQSYARLVEDVGTATIKILQSFASVPRVAAIAGKSNRPYMRQFTGQDLALIDRVTVNMGNAITKTPQGKQALADVYMEKGLISNPDQYVQVLTTGRMELVIEGKQAQTICIKGENEALSDGKPQRALITDDHAKHILEHSVVMASPEARQDPNSPIAQVTLAHIQEHINFAQSPGYQSMAAMLGHQVMVPPAPPMMPGGAGASAPSNVGGMLNPAPADVQMAEQVNMPNMPSAPPNTAPETADVINQEAVA